MKCLLFLSLAALMSFSEVKGQGCLPYLIFPGHTMCIYNEKTCTGANLMRSGELTCEEKEELLTAHNKYRQKVANGQEAGQPPAADMSELVWDDELAMIAQRWADQCTFGHDAVRRVTRFSVGQNAYAISHRPVETDLSAPMAMATDGWYSEVSLFDPVNIEPYNFQYEAGHYTQLAWADTHTIGCGYSMYEKGDGWSTKFVVCNYGVHGNLIGGRMYTQGSPNCAAFPNRSPSPRYPGLCEITDSNPPGTGCAKSENVAKFVENKVKIEESDVQVIENVM